jgi:membrane dipeptidase
MSHVGVHEFAPYAMNPTKEDIRAIADTGGVVGIIAMTYWLSKPEVHQGAEIILKTIDHLIQHGGEDVVAFGSDFDGFTGPPKDWKSPRDYAFIRELLLKHYSEEQAQKFLNGNADRVLKMGWGKG